MIFAVPLLRVITALADLLLSATADALRVTATLAGSDAGPVNVVAAPLGVLAGLNDPHAGEQLVPFCVSVQLRPPLVGSKRTVAANCSVALIGIIPLTGEIASTMIAGSLTVAT